MKKNTIIIGVTVVILLIIGAVYYYENYVARSNNMSVYPESAKLLKEAPEKALEYCDENATIDSFDSGADCLAEVLCAADKLDKIKELCEAGTLQYPPKDESEKQKLIDECIETVKIACKNPNDAINLCKDNNCFMALSIISLKKGYEEIARKSCYKIDDGRKEDCYDNLIYSSAKINKTHNEMLEVCNMYENENFDYLSCGIGSKCTEKEIKDYRMQNKLNCYMLVAKLTSKTDKKIAKEICNKIPIEGIDYKKECLNNCLDDNQTEEFCNEACSVVPKNKREECLTAIL